MNIRSSVVIDGRNLGTSEGNVVLDGGNTFDATGVSQDTGCRIFEATHSAKLTLLNLELRHAYSDVDFGGAIGLVEATLAVTNCVFRENIAVFGGAIGVEAGDIFGADILFDRNLSGLGGGAVHSSGTLLLDNASFVSNIVTGTRPYVLPKGGMQAAFWYPAGYGRGGAIDSDLGPIVVQGCSFVGNRSVSGGAAISVISWGYSLPRTTAVVLNSTFFQNSALSDLMEEELAYEREEPTQAGAIFSYDSSMQILGCTFLDNDSNTGLSLNFYYGSVAMVNCIAIGKGSTVVYFKPSPNIGNFCFNHVSSCNVSGAYPGLVTGVTESVFAHDAEGALLPTHFVRRGVPHLLFRPVEQTLGAKLLLGETTGTIGTNEFGNTWTLSADVGICQEDLTTDEVSNFRDTWEFAKIRSTAPGYEYYRGAASPKTSSVVGRARLTGIHVGESDVELSFETDLSPADFSSWLICDGFRIQPLCGRSLTEIDETASCRGIQFDEEGRGLLRMDLPSSESGVFRLLVE